MPGGWSPPAAKEVAAQGKGVTVIDGKMVEVLHVAEAERLLAQADAIAAFGCWGHKMAHNRIALVFSVLLAAFVSVPAFAADKQLNLYIWSDYLAPDTIANFTKATGIKVNVDVFDSSEMLEAKLLAGKSGYDVIVPNGPVLTRLIKAGVVARPLDKTKLPHIVTQDPAITGARHVADPGNAYGIIYMWGTSGLGYNVAKVAKALGKDAAVDSWSLIFDPAKAAKLAKCGIYVFDSPSDIFQQNSP